MVRLSCLSGALVLFTGPRLIFGANNVIWRNHCDYDLFFWIVGTQQHESDNAYTRVPARGELVDSMKELGGSGAAIKIRDVPYYTVAPAGILQLEYFVDHVQNKVFYDSSIINCDINAGPQSPWYCPFAHGGVNLSVPEKLEPLFECKDAYCRLGGKCNRETYLVPGGYPGEPSLSCGIGIDIVFETCVEASVERTWENGKPGPAPAHPLPPPPPSPPSPPPPPPSPGQWQPPTPVAESFVTVTKVVTQFPLHTGYPTTYPVPPGFPEDAVCFDPRCWCHGTYSDPNAGRANCSGMEGTFECYYSGDCDTWFQGGR